MVRRRFIKNNKMDLTYTLWKKVAMLGTGALYQGSYKNNNLRVSPSNTEFGLIIAESRLRQPVG